MKALFRTAVAAIAVAVTAPAFAKWTILPQTPPDITLACIVQTQDGRTGTPLIEIWFDPPIMISGHTTAYDVKIEPRVIRYSGSGPVMGMDEKPIANMITATSGLIDRVTGTLHEVTNGSGWISDGRTPMEMSGHCSAASQRPLF
jgi:hypothetical protein